MKMMKVTQFRIVAISLGLLFSLTGIGQQKQMTLCEIYDNDFTAEETKLVNENIRTTPSSSWKRLADLYSLRALINVKINKSIMKENPALYKDVVNDAQDDLDYAVNLIEDEKLKIEYIFRRQEVLTHKEDYDNKQTDLQALKLAGYKEGYGGTGLSVKVRYDGSLWYGGEIAGLSYRSPKYTLSNGYGHVFEKESQVVGSGFTFAYMVNPENNRSEWTASLLKTESPIYIDIIQFGGYSDQSSTRYFYRPEIGFGVGPITLSYGYTLFFKRGDSRELNKHVLNLKGRYIIPWKK